MIADDEDAPAFDIPPPDDDVPHAAEANAHDARPTNGHAGPTRPRLRRATRQVVADILKHKDDPVIELRLGGDVLTFAELGGLVVVIGGTGRGKSSLAANLALEHARDVGPALACSLELPDRQWVARAIGTRCDESWSGVLHGKVDEARMLQVLPERLSIIDRDHASLEVLRAEIADMQREYPGQPLLAVVDYVQLIGADSDDDIRPRVGRVMRQLDKIAREAGVVIIALSQGSRISARALTGGEKLGAETVDAGAESAAIEQWASVTISIGKRGDEVSSDGSRPVSISIGKSRMDEKGDTVVDAREWGRSGLWRLTGEARPAAEVRAERASQAEDGRIANAKLAMVAAAERSPEPLTRTALRKAAHVRGTAADAAITALLSSGELVEVHRRMRGMKVGEWPLWTPARATGAVVVRGAE
jgi:hypothetical protein